MKVLVIATHNPDGGTEVDVFVDGALVRDDDLEVAHVDAGRGYTWEDWTENRDHWLDNARRDHGPRAVSAMQAAFDDPPGGEYIADKPEDAAWI
jgi:hypothetical protein